MSIEFKNVGYTYLKKSPFEKKVLHDINFKINNGEVVSIIGHTGSGKSTLIQLMNLLLKDYEGKIIIDSLDVSDKKVKSADIRRRFGISFQYPEYQFFEENIYKDISFSLRIRGEDEISIEQKVRKAMKMVNLDFKKYRDKSPFEISGGEKRKVSLASILVLDPEYIILDEPTVGLDPKSCEEIISIISNLNKNFNKTIIIVTHIMDLAYSLSDRIILMSNGRIENIDTPYNLFKNDEIIEKYSIERPYLVKLYLSLINKGINIGECPKDITGMEKLLQDYFIKGRIND